MEIGEISDFLVNHRFASGVNFKPITAHIQEEIPWCKLFTFDMVLMDESRD